MCCRVSAPATNHLFSQLSDRLFYFQDIPLTKSILQHFQPPRTPLKIPAPISPAPVAWSPLLTVTTVNLKMPQSPSLVSYFQHIATKTRQNQRRRLFENTASETPQVRSRIELTTGLAGQAQLKNYHKSSKSSSPGSNIMTGKLSLPEMRPHT